MLDLAPHLIDRRSLSALQIAALWFSTPSMTQRGSGLKVVITASKSCLETPIPSKRNATREGAWEFSDSHHRTITDSIFLLTACWASRDQLMANTTLSTRWRSVAHSMYMATMSAR